MDSSIGLIDVHHHAIPELYLAALAERGVRAPVQGASFPAWDPEASLAVMDEAGIATAILSISSPGLADAAGEDACRLARRVNEHLAGVVHEHPTRFGAFALIPVHEMSSALGEVAYALDQLGLDGVGVYTSTWGRYLGDSQFEPLLATLADRQVPVFVHPVLPPQPGPLFGAPGSVAEFPIETTRAVMSLLFSGTLDRHPGLKLILSHAGGTVPFLAPRIAHAATIDPDLRGKPPADLLGSLRRLYYDVAMSATPTQLACLGDLVDPSHILFGSDFPFMPAHHALDNAAGLRRYPGLSAPQLERVGRANALDLFPRVRPA